MPFLVRYFAAVDVGTSDNTCQVTNCLTCEIGTTTRCVRCIPGFVVNTTTNVCDVSEDSGGGGGGDDSGRTIDELVLVGETILSVITSRCMRIKSYVTHVSSCLHLISIVLNIVIPNIHLQVLSLPVYWDLWCSFL